VARAVWIFPGVFFVGICKGEGLGRHFDVRSLCCSLRLEVFIKKPMKLTANTALFHLCIFYGSYSLMQK
jgi:hypothetical protein